MGRGAGSIAASRRKVVQVVARQAGRIEQGYNSGTRADTIMRCRVGQPTRH